MYIVCQSVFVPTPNQTKFIKALDNKKPMVIAVGPAGTGKTFISCTKGIQKLIEKKIEKLVITRPAVAVDAEEHGFLPGGIHEKMMPWMMPLYDSFHDVVNPKTIRQMLVNGDIEVCPLTYIRGRTFNDCWVIADEMQNSTPSQMKTLLTRMGENSKIIVSGDLNQSDICGVNGLGNFMKEIEKKDLEENPNVDIISFSHDDIKRSDFVKYVLTVYGEI